MCPAGKRRLEERVDVVSACGAEGVRGSQSVGSASGAAAQGVNRSRSTSL